MIPTAEKKRIWDYMAGVTDYPRQPKPSKPIDKRTYQQGHNDGWNAAVAFYKELGKI